MNLSRSPRDGVLQLTVAGRLDGYWADHLDAALTEAVREGNHHLRLDLAQVTFLSSAGIAVLMKFYRQLSRISGSLAVISTSAPVRVVLDMARLSTVLIAPEIPHPAVAQRPRSGRHLDREGATFEVFDLGTRDGLRCRAIGGEEFLSDGGEASDCISLGSLTPVLLIGVGAFGEGFDDCRPRFGELISVAGATAYQPADGTNVPDYLVSSATLAADIRVLYCLSCDGEFTHLARFESTPGGTVGMTDLAEACLHISGGSAAGFVVIGEAAGLVGAVLRRSPANHTDDFFVYPAIRQRLTFTAEKAFPRSLALTAGVVVRDPDGLGGPQLRPLGHGALAGHVHAAAFPFRPLTRGAIDLKETVASLFEQEPLLGVLHLLHDDRGPAGAGDSEFIRGVCWIGPIPDGIGQAKAG